MYTVLYAWQNDNMDTTQEDKTNDIIIRLSPHDALFTVVSLAPVVCTVLEKCMVQVLPDLVRFWPSTTAGGHQARGQGPAAAPR